MDEPTAGQDYKNYMDFMDAILRLPSFEAILFITHDVDLAVIYANRVLLVNRGALVADGPPQDVLSDEQRLRENRLVPTSLLRANLERLPTGVFCVPKRSLILPPGSATSCLWGSKPTREESIEMNRTLSIVLALVVVLIIFLAVSWIVASSNPDLSLSNPLMRFVFVIIGLLIAFAIYWFTRDRDIWLVGTREVVYMAIGAALYAIFSYLFNGTVFVVPSVSQVALRPAIVIPMFFGHLRPCGGLFHRRSGQYVRRADRFRPFPQWSSGGLVGLIAGLAMFPDRKKGLNTILGVSGALALLATLFYIAFRNTANMLFFDPNNNIFGDALISPIAGLSVLIGFLLVLAVRYIFRSNLEVAAAVTWAMLGNIIGIGFAALSDIWINGFTLGVAIVGEFIPAANLIFAAVLLPILRLTPQSATSGRWVPLRCSRCRLHQSLTEIAMLVTWRYRKREGSLLQRVDPRAWFIFFGCFLVSTLMFWDFRFLLVFALIALFFVLTSRIPWRECAAPGSSSGSLSPSTPCSPF
jgi:hypothetical protein